MIPRLPWLAKVKQAETVEAMALKELRFCTSPGEAPAFIRAVAEFAKLGFTGAEVEDIADRISRGDIVANSPHEGGIVSVGVLGARASQYPGRPVVDITLYREVL